METLGTVLYCLWLLVILVALIVLAGTFLLVAGLMMLPFIIIAAVFL